MGLAGCGFGCVWVLLCVVGLSGCGGNRFICVWIWWCNGKEKGIVLFGLTMEGLVVLKHQLTLDEFCAKSFYVFLLS